MTERPCDPDSKHNKRVTAEAEAVMGLIAGEFGMSQYIDEDDSEHPRPKPWTERRYSYEYTAADGVLREISYWVPVTLAPEKKAELYKAIAENMRSAFERSLREHPRVP